MIFGDRLSAPDNAEAAAWLTDAVNIERWTVGGLLPANFESYVLVEGAAESDSWWASQRRIVATLADVLSQFTETPEESWFAVWEGHGFDSNHTGVGWGGDDDPTVEQRADMKVQKAAANAEDARLAEATRNALAQIPTFGLAARTYYLLRGHVTDVRHLRWPIEPSHWFRPDLWWPQDRKWFVGTDVDFWCNYIGGSRATIDAITTRLPESCHPVTINEPLRLED